MLLVCHQILAAFASVLFDQKAVLWARKYAHASETRAVGALSHLSGRACVCSMKGIVNVYFKHEEKVVAGIIYWETVAMHSISTRTSLGRRATSTHERAGRAPPKRYLFCSIKKRTVRGMRKNIMQQNERRRKGKERRTYAAVNLIDDTKVVHVLEEDGRLDDLTEGGVGGLEDLVHVGKDLLLKNQSAARWERLELNVLFSLRFGHPLGYCFELFFDLRRTFFFFELSVIPCLPV